MVKLNISEYFMTIVLHQDFVVFRLDEEGIWNFQKVIKCHENVKKSDGSIECCSFSPCGKYFGICFDKTIFIYNTEDWSLVASSPGERKASSLQFFSNSKIILLADKSGCASFYSFKENYLEKNELALGHNSMLTGALITHNEKFIITIDRDEKIRITHYPNVYNIKGFCLGHEMFVSCIGFLPHDKRILVSSSGDGTIRFWDFIAGQHLALYSCNNPNKNEKTILKKCVFCECDQQSIIAVLEYKSNKVRIINVSGDLNIGLKIELMEMLTFNVIPWDVAFYQQTLLCLTPDSSNPLQFWGEESKFTKVSQYLTVNWDFIISKSKKIPDDIPTLFKREVDNLKEYEQRKRARLLKTGKTS